MRRPWEIPMQYNEDRFDDRPTSPPPSEGDEPEEKTLEDIEELLSRRSDTAGVNDIPLQYRDPHNEYLGQVGGSSDLTIDYRRGPHQTEFGVEDED